MFKQQAVQHASCSPWYYRLLVCGVDLNVFTCLGIFSMQTAVVANKGEILVIRIRACVCDLERPTCSASCIVYPRRMSAEYKLVRPRRLDSEHGTSGKTSDKVVVGWISARRTSV